VLEGDPGSPTNTILPGFKHHRISFLVVGGQHASSNLATSKLRSIKMRLFDDKTRKAMRDMTNKKLAVMTEVIFKAVLKKGRDKKHTESEDR